MSNSCPVCWSNQLERWNNLYFTCGSCGHRTADSLDTSEIVNEALVKSKMLRFDALDRFKRQALLRHSVSFDGLIDFGCGSGKFLYQNRELFKWTYGIEITRECVEFARTELGLEVSERLPDHLKPSVVTFWHSLEHLPIDLIRKSLKAIGSAGDKKLRLIISVPAADSFLHRLLGENDPYYDPSSHIHEFTEKSLRCLLKECGFAIERKLFSFPYSLFGWAQGISNLFHPVRNYFYYRFRRDNSVAAAPAKDVSAIALFFAALPAALLLTFCERTGLLKSSVMTVVAYRTQT